MTLNRQKQIETSSPQPRQPLKHFATGKKCRILPTNHPIASQYIDQLARVLGVYKVGQHRMLHVQFKDGVRASGLFFSEVKFRFKLRSAADR
jgi:hypothetical protein